MKLLVTDVKAGDHSVLNDALARDEVHVLDCDALAVTAFLQGIVKPSAEYGQDADIAAESDVNEVVQSGKRGRKHAEIGVEADDFGGCHEPACPRTAGYVIIVDQAVRLEPVYTCIVPQVCRKQACIFEDTMRHGCSRLVSTG